MNNQSIVSQKFDSVGNLFREVAAKRGISVAEQAKLLLTERGIDLITQDGEDPNFFILPDIAERFDVRFCPLM